MKHVEFIPSGVCCKLISFDLDTEGKIYNVNFAGGCPGNLKAISKLLEGASAETTAKTLQGNTCGPRPTSCADQLSKALVEAIEQNK